MYKSIAISGLALMTSACATITQGTTQPMHVETIPHAGAKCKLRDSAGGSWLIVETPGVATVNKGDGPMRVRCEKEHKGKKFVGNRSVTESIETATAGNLLVGGIIGAGIDAASGAAQKYQQYVEVYLREVE